MCKLLFVFLFIHCIVTKTNCHIDQNFKTLHGYEDPPDGRQKSVIFNAENKLGVINRQKRATENSTPQIPTVDNGIITKVGNFFGI